MKLKTPTAAPTRKLVVGGTSSIALGGSVTVILFWIMSLAHLDPPDAVRTAIGMLVTWLFFALGSYVAAPAEGDVPVPDVIGPPTQVPPLAGGK